MELVYLWVEDYKNIHEQGFNFSPKFNCHYDGETLTIKNNVDEDENKQYIENFFGDNINITAIVGKNGSGKTTIFRVIEDIWKRIGTIDNDKYILCYYIGTKIYILTELRIFVNTNSDYIHISNDKDFQSFFYNHDLLISYAEIQNYSEGEYFYKSKEDYEITFQESKIYDMVLRVADQELPLSTFMMNPKNVTLDIQKEEQENILRLITPQNKIYFKDELSYQNYCIKNFGEYREIINYYVNHNRGNLLEIYFVWQIIKNKYFEKLFEDIVVPKNTNDKFIEILELDSNKIINIVNKFDLNSENYSFSEFNFLLEKKTFDLLKISNDNSNLLKKYIKFFKFDYIDKNGSRYSELSQGEKIIYGQFLNILNYIRDKESLIVLLDEPNNAFHPQWQKKYINELIQCFKEYHINFIITSHSPFLLSDIPKQNIIFLDTYEKEDKEVINGKQKVGNCKVLSHNEVLAKKQTFGANIHTLLSDSFFMEDGLMGEFAKGKINEIKRFYEEVIKEDKKEVSNFSSLEKKYKNNKTKFEQIQSIIGEPFLKTVIKNYLDEIENILFDDAKAKKMAIKRFIDEFGEDSVSEVLDDKA